MAIKRLPAIQDARKAPLMLEGDVAVLFGLIGDSNAVGFDAATSDWSARAPDLPANGIVSGMGIWNKWTVDPNASRSSAADTGTDFYSQGDCGLLDHGGSVWLGTGQYDQANGPENGLGYYARLGLLEAAPGPLYNGARTLFLPICKYGVAGSVVHDAPANPAAGWNVGGTSAGCYRIFNNYYLRPAITKLIADGYDAIYYGGTVAILGGTDAIDPGGVFTDPGDAEQVAQNIHAILQGLHGNLGCDKAPTVLVQPPFTYEGGTSNSGYPNMTLVRGQIHDLVARRNAMGLRTAELELQDCERISDYLHYSNYGQWVAGRRMARALASQGWLLHRLTAAPAVIA